jgi:type I restriction enzyme S subunit
MDRSDLPERWNVTTIGSVIENTAKRNPSVSPNDEFLYVDISSVDSANGVIQDPKRLIGNEAPSRARNVIQTDDVVFATTRPYLRNIALVPSRLNNQICSTGFAVLRAKQNQIEPRWLYYLCRSEIVMDQVVVNMRGGTYPAVSDKDVFAVEVPLPSLDEQRSIVARIEEFAKRVAEISQRHSEMEPYAHEFLLSAYASITEDVPLMPMGEVAPLVRRPVKVKPKEAYHELGLRSFGKGTFHKPAIMGSALGSKRIFHIEPGDLLFSNVFSWEGAIAVAKREDSGRVGSHRYITCVAKEGVAKASYLCFHFLTERGLQQIGGASPGSAGRNRTLGLKALENIQVPVPSFEKQVWFDALVTKLNAIRAAQLATQQELDALMPSVLHRAFAGEL